MTLSYRSILNADQEFLQKMLFLALFVPPGQPPFPEEIIWEPHLHKYHTNWGRVGDAGWIAETEDQAIGAAWYRLHSLSAPSYGFLGEDTPEINIALENTYRSNGVGTVLLQKLLASARMAGFPALSLSVDERNPALRLYERLGFEAVRQEKYSVTMRRTL